MGEVLIQVIRQTSECTKREFEKILLGFRSSRKPTKKCAMKMKETKKTKKNNDARVKMLLMVGSTL